MSSSPLRHKQAAPGPKDVVYVQNLIERCLQQYMSKGVSVGAFIGGSRRVLCRFTLGVHHSWHSQHGAS